MSQVLQDFGNKYCKDAVPELKPGYLIKVYQKIKEGNKERIQIFQGTVIKTNAGHGVNDTFTVRKISEGIGVEKVFPIHAPSITKIEVLRAYKVRRSNLGYLRKLSGKALRLKEIPLKLREKLFSKPVKKEEKKVEDKKEEVSSEAKA